MCMKALASHCLMIILFVSCDELLCQNRVWKAVVSNEIISNTYVPLYISLEREQVYNNRSSAFSVFYWRKARGNILAQDNDITFRYNGTGVRSDIRFYFDDPKGAPHSWYFAAAGLYRLVSGYFSYRTTTEFYENDQFFHVLSGGASVGYQKIYFHFLAFEAYLEVMINRQLGDASLVDENPDQLFPNDLVEFNGFSIVFGVKTGIGLSK